MGRPQDVIPPTVRAHSGERELSECARRTERRAVGRHLAITGPLLTAGVPCLARPDSPWGARGPFAQIWPGGGTLVPSSPPKGPTAHSTLSARLRTCLDCCSKPAGDPRRRRASLCPATASASS